MFYSRALLSRSIGWASKSDTPHLGLALQCHGLFNLARGRGVSRGALLNPQIKNTIQVADET